MISKSKIFEVYQDEKRRLYTQNATPGVDTYGERLVTQNKIEYRQWDTYSSKLGAAIANGATNVCMRKGDIVLYLGSASGTTVSHVSDIVGPEGFVFGVDISPFVMRDFLFNMAKRNNVCPVLLDANRVDSLGAHVCTADVLFQDIAQKNQVDIFLKNLHQFVKKGGYGILAVKSRSIDVTKKPRDIFKQVRSQLEAVTTIIDYRSLEPFQKDHALFIVKRRA